MDKKSREEIFDHLTRITMFRGSVLEYERWRGYECDILGPSYRIPYSDSLSQEDEDMYASGIEAIVNIQDYVGGVDVYNKQIEGLPIRRKANNSVNSKS